MWAFVCAYAFGGIPLAFVIYGAAIYLSQVLGKSQVEIGSVLWIPPLGWELGYFFWGWLSDRSLKSDTSRINALRAMLGAAALFSLPLMATPRLISFWAVMLALFFAMFVAAGFIILSIAYATEVYSGEHSGFLAGLGAGSWSAVVALMMPVFGRLFDVHRWDLAFALAAIFPVAGYGAWFLLIRRQQRLPTEKITARC
jgi:ACS family hexuronate transporter-like MFS transporter